MARNALPENYLLNSGAVVEGFETLTDWAIISGTGTLAAEETYVKQGSRGLRVNVTTNGGTVEVAKEISLDLSAASRLLGFWAYAYEDAATPLKVAITVSSAADYSKYFYQEWPINYKGWHYLCKHRSEWATVFNAESWQSTIVRIKLTVTARAGSGASVAIDALTSNTETIPKCLIQFDDGYDDVYANAYSYMSGRSIPGTAYIVTDKIGEAGRMTVAQLQEMYAAGWAIGNHTTDHGDITTTEAGAISRLQGATDWIVANGMPNGAYHVAYPNGVYNTTVTLPVMAQLSMKTGRTVEAGQQYLPAGNIYRLACYNVLDTTPLATVCGYVDTALRNKSSVLVLFHHIVAAPAAATEWSIADFQAFIRYVQASGIDCVAVDEWFDGLSHARKAAR